MYVPWSKLNTPVKQFCCHCCWKVNNWKINFEFLTTTGHKLKTWKCNSSYNYCGKYINETPQYKRLMKAKKNKNFKVSK